MSNMEIRLPELSAAGYLWTVDKVYGDVVVTDEHVPPPQPLTGELLVGGAGTKVFTLTGEGTIWFKYSRPWETKVEKWFSVTMP